MTNISHWRYQSVIKDGVVSLCEVYIGEDGKLDGWTDGKMIPQGENYQELLSDLAAMAEDCSKYEPVEYAELKIGMVFNLNLSNNIETAKL